MYLENAALPIMYDIG